MANGVIAKGDVVAVGDQRLVAVTHCKRYEVIGFAIERGRNAGGNGGDHALEIERIDGDFSRGGIADAVGRLGNGSEPNYVGGAASDSWSCLRHARVHSTQRRMGAGEVASFPRIARMNAD